MRSRILPPRAAGILGIAGLTVTATVGFAVSAMADSSTPSASISGSASKSGSASPSSSESDSSSSPSETADPTPADWTLTGPTEVKSSGTGTYTVTLKAASDKALTTTTLTPHGTWHGGTVEWSNCSSVDGVKCTVDEVAKGDSRTLTLTYSAPKTTKNLSGSMIVTVANDALSDATKSIGLLVKKAPSPTPTKSHTSTPTKSTSPSKPGNSGGSGGSHDSGGKKSHAPKPAPSGHGQVPAPLFHPPKDVPSSLPSVPMGSQPPMPNGVPTDVPTLPSVAPSPEGSPRVPNVAEPPRKASGEARTDAVSLPAAAAAAFLGIGAGTAITRSVRRRGLMRTIGRHRD